MLTAQQPHAPDQRDRGDFVGWNALEGLLDLSNHYPRWQVMGSVGQLERVLALSTKRSGYMIPAD